MAVVGEVHSVYGGVAMPVQFQVIEGESFADVAPKLLAAAKETGCMQTTTILGIPVVVRPVDKLEDVKRDYFALLRDRHDDRQPEERRVHSARRKFIHEESIGRRKTDRTTSIPLLVEPIPESSP
jgi:hypothetical protein